jgi:hypothetical protein
MYGCFLLWSIRCTKCESEYASLSIGVEWMNGWKCFIHVRIESVGQRWLRVYSCIEIKWSLCQRENDGELVLIWLLIKIEEILMIQVLKRNHQL